MFLTALFRIAKKWWQPTDSSTGEQINKWSTCATAYDSPIKKNEALTGALT